jgi:hypothetical protein
MKYFELVPKIMYPYMGKMVESKDGNINSVEVVDLTIRFKIIDTVINDASSYFYYKWEDGDRPDIVARKMYGDANLAWIVMLSASAFDWAYDLPMTEKAFTEYLFNKYGKDENELTQVVHHYETGRGYIIDSLTYVSLADSGKKTISVFDYESKLNDNRRIIKLINNSSIQTIIKEYSSKLKEIKTNRKLMSLV